MIFDIKNNSIVKLFIYSFVSSLVFGIFVMLIWFIYRSIGSNDFFNNWRSELSYSGLVGSFIGLCFGSLLTIVESIKNKKDKGNVQNVDN